MTVIAGVVASIERFSLIGRKTIKKAGRSGRNSWLVLTNTVNKTLKSAKLSAKKNNLNFLLSQSEAFSSFLKAKKKLTAQADKQAKSSGIENNKSGLQLRLLEPYGGARESAYHAVLDRH